MGLEWHNRRRRSDGRYISDMTAAMQAKPVQIHIRVPWEIYNIARQLANAQEMEMTVYVTKALEDLMRHDRIRFKI